jgi:hypothetical protein
MVETKPRKRDRVRIVAWSLTALVGILGSAGIVYESEPDLEVLCGSASFALDIGATDFAREQIGRAADPWVNLLQARVALLEADHAAAQRYLARTLERDPGNQEAHLHFGWSAYECGDWATSLAHYEAGGDVLRQSGRADLFTEYQIRVATLLIAVGRLDEAEAIACELIASGERSAAGHLISAFSHLARGDDTKFGLALERAHSSDPLEPLFRQGQGPLSSVFPWLPAP